MGNLSNPEQWATMERLRFIERSAYWRGVVNRQDLAGVFGLSMAQASADLQRYQEMNPGALVYNLRKKRYEGAVELVPVCHEPRLEEGIATFLEAGPMAVSPRATAAGNGRVEVLAMPERRAPAGVERRLFLAVLHGQRVRVRYASVSSGAETERWLHPRAFAHNGSRWHVRAWCEGRREWRDFSLGRFLSAEWPVESGAEPPVDEAWHSWVTLRLRAHSGLSAEARAAVEVDYGMTDGVLTVRTRRAVENYLRSRLRVALADGSLPPPLLEEIE